MKRKVILLRGAWDPTPPLLQASRAAISLQVGVEAQARSCAVHPPAHPSTLTSFLASGSYLLCSGLSVSSSLCSVSVPLHWLFPLPGTLPQTSQVFTQVSPLGPLLNITAPPPVLSAPHYLFLGGTQHP